MKYCPNCGGSLTADTTIYIIKNEPVACEYCVSTMYADEFFEENELAKTQDDFENYMWDMGQEMKALMSFKGGGK